MCIAILTRAYITVLLEGGLITMYDWWDSLAGPHTGNIKLYSLLWFLFILGNDKSNYLWGKKTPQISHLFR